MPGCVARWGHRDLSGTTAARIAVDYYHHAFATRAELVAAVDKWMAFYNNRRRHSVIGMLSPIAYEQSLNAAKQAA